MNCFQLVGALSSCSRDFFLLFVLLSGLVFAQTQASAKPAPTGPDKVPPSKAASNLKTEGDQTLTLDPVCSACQGAYLDLKLRNDGDKPVPISFSRGPIVSKPEGKPFPATVDIVPMGSTGAKADKALTSLQPHSTTAIRVTITGVLGEAEWTIPLRNQGEDLISIKVANPKPDFTVKLDSATPDNPEVSFERNRPTTLTLRNDSDAPYSVVASYIVNSRPANLLSMQSCQTASAPVAPKPDQPCIVKLPAHSTVPLTVMPLEDWFVLPPSPALHWTWRIHPLRWSAGWAAWALSRVGVLLKDQTAEGRLQVQMASPACSQDSGSPILSFKANTHLAAFSKDSQSFGGNAVIFLVLLLGGTFSLILNFLLPMQARRHNLKASLQQAGRKITDLSLALDSRVRVPVGVERQRLAQRIKDLSLLNTQYGPDVTDIEQSLDRLMKRLDLLDQMQLSLAGYSRAQQHDLPATLVRQTESIRKQVLDLLQKSDPTDADLQKVLGLIQEIENRLTGFGQADAGFAKLLFDELTRRRNERITNPPTGPLAFLWNAVPGFSAEFLAGFADLSDSLAQELASAPPDLEHMQPEDYAPLDALRGRLTLLEKYQRILNGHPKPTSAFSHCSVRLLAELRNNTWDSLTDAERLVLEMQESVFPENIIDQVTNDHVKIKVDRIVIRQFETATFSLEFDIDDLKDAAACEEFTYRWNFNDGLTEDGWTVSHYFQTPTIVQALGWFKLLKREVRYWWRRLLFGFQTGNWGPPPDEIHAPYDVQATLVANYDGTVVAHKIPLRDGRLQVEPPLPPAGHALLAELVRLLLALGLAVLGLVAGAKDQILKLDVVPALIAVFLLGVGADQIKNLLTQQPAGK